MAVKRTSTEDPEDRLKAYDGKDYTEAIEFPVELVDRDGVVRRYSYEESLAVYHRRIQSAPWRYADEALIRAEIGHCTRRIDQIKRSFRQRARSSEGAPPIDPRAALGEGYDVLRRHFQKVVERRGLMVDGDPPLKLTLLSDEADYRAYHVGTARGGAQLLYVYPFDRPGDEAPQRAYREAVATLERVPDGPGVERLLLAETTADAGYVLTGTHELPDVVLGAARPKDDAPPQPEYDVDVAPGFPPRMPDPEPPSGMSEARDALRRAEPEAALDALRRTVAENPFQRDALLTLLALLENHGQFEEAAMYAEMGACYFPDDPAVLLRQGAIRVRRGDVDGGLAALTAAQGEDGGPPQAAWLAAQVLAARGDYRGAASRLDAVTPLDPAAKRGATLLRAAFGFGRAAFVASAATVLGGAAAYGAGYGIGLALVPLGFAGIVIGRPIAYLIARAALRRPGS